MSHNISRRSFMRLATDSLIALPTVAGGFLAVTPTQAIAADKTDDESEEHGGIYSGAEAEIVIVNRWEVGFMLLDMADGGEGRIPNAYVQIQSRYNRDKWARGYTDEAGVVVLDVSQLAENPDNKDPMSLDSYEFNASITITCKGYRDFKITLTRIKAGGGFLIPGRSITDTKPYPELVSFDEWDVLYTIESYETYDKGKQGDGKSPTTPDFLTFNSSPKNTDKHTLIVSLKNLDESATVRLCERTSGKELLSQTVQPKDNAGTATFTGAFAQYGASDALPVDTDFDVFFNQGGVKYSFPIKLRLTKTIFNEKKTIKDRKASPLTNIKNSMGGGSTVALTFPPSSPLAKGELFTMWLPEFPINVYIDPSGYYQLTAKTPSWGYKNDYGKEDEAGWQWMPRKSVADQMKAKRDSWEKIIDKTGEAYDPENGMNGQISYSRTFSFSGWLQFLAVAQWDKDSKTFQGDAAAQAVIALNLSIVESFLAGPVPVFIQFDLKSSATLSVGPGFTVQPKDSDADFSEIICDFSRYEWDYYNTGLSFTVVIAPSLSIGVGIAGVASISLRGTFTLTIFTGVTAHESGKPLPHFVVGYVFKGDVVAQFFLWTYAWTVFNDSKPDWYNNWKNLSAQAVENELNPMATNSYDDVAQNIRPVTDEMLLKSREFDGNTPITAQSDESEIYLDVEYNDDFVMDDGTTLTRAIYTLKVHGQEEDTEEASAEPVLVAQAEGDSQEASQTLEGEGALTAEADQTEEETESSSIEEILAASPFAYPIPGDYVSTRDDESSLVAMADTTPGVAGIGDDGGIRPTSDTALVTNVFGDPRLKVIEVDGTVYSLRIGSVTVNNKPVTRIIATVLSGYRAAVIGKKQVLDFSLSPAIAGIDRSDLCDYEFDIIPASYNAGGGMVSITNTRMHVAVISGVRNTSNFAKASTDLVLSYVQFHHDKEKGFNWVITNICIEGSKVFPDSSEYTHHSISNLNMSLYQPALDSDLATITYLDRVAKTAEGVMRDDDVKVRMGVVFVPHTRSSTTNAHFVVPDPATIEQKMGSITDLSIFELETWPEVNSIFTFMMRGASTAYYYVMRRSDSSDNPGIEFIKQVGTTAPHVRLHAWKVVSEGGGYKPVSVQRFLTCGEDNRLCYAQVSQPWSQSDAKLNFWDQGPDEFGISSFGVFGDFVYWPETRSGVPGHKLDPDTGELVELPEVNECHLKASRLRNDSHSEPFILADCSYVSDDDPGHMLDDVVSVIGDSTALSVVASELTDRENDLATIWYLRIPYVKTVTALHATAVTPFVAPGKKAGFYITLRNDGNTFLSGCDLAMYDKETMYSSSGNLTAPEATGTVTFSLDTIRESPWNPRDKNGNLTKIEPDGALAPGATSVYLAEIIIPEKWKSGRKEVVFITRNGTVVGELSGQADEDSEIVEYSMDPGKVTMDVVIIEEPYWKEAYLSDSPVTVYDDDDTDPSGTTPSGTDSGSSGGSSGSGRSKGTLPQTGDEPISPAIGLAGAGLAAAGALISAYEKRRAENEQQ